MKLFIPIMLIIMCGACTTPSTTKLASEHKREIPDDLFVCQTMQSNPNTSIDFATFNPGFDADISAGPIPCLTGDCTNFAWQMKLIIYIVNAQQFGYPYSNMVEYSFHDFEGDCHIDVMLGGYGLPVLRKQAIYSALVRQIASFIREEQMSKR